MKNLAWLYAQGARGPTNTPAEGAGPQIHSEVMAPDHALAEVWMRKAVDINSTQGKYDLALLLINERDNGGQPDPRGFPAAAAYFRQAAEQGHAQAQYQLAEMCLRGQYGDRTNCIPWFLKAADQGVPEAQAELVNLHRVYPDDPLLKSADLMAQLRQSAEDGNTDAQFQMAKRYQTGTGVPQNPAEAFKWMQKAAQGNQTPGSGSIDAVYELGLMYASGQGVETNKTKALSLLLEAANAAHPDAAFLAGQMYENGSGAPRDESQAAQYYYIAVVNLGGRYQAQAAEHLLALCVKYQGLAGTNQETGDDLIKTLEAAATTPKALFLAGKIHNDGALVPRDPVQAAIELQAASDRGSAEATALLSEVKTRLSPEQLDSLKQRSATLEIILQERSLAQKAKAAQDIPTSQ